MRCARPPSAMARVMRRLLLVVAGVCLVACLSPTVPRPPPTQPAISGPDATGSVRLQGVAASSSEVLAYNHSNKVIAGQVTGNDARYDIMIKAQVGDTIEFWYTQGTDESPSISF